MTPTVLITGTSSGIGRASARLFQSRGWNVIATQRRPDEETELSALDRVMVTRLDVADQDSITNAVEAGRTRFGRIDVLINNAGYGLYGLFESLPRKSLHDQFAVNVFGVMDVTRAALPHFRANGGGVVVNVSSGAGLFTLPAISAYCASKFALEGFTEALAYELGAVGIGVKLVIPHGGVEETAFHARASAENAAQEVPADYAPFLERTRRAFAAMAAARMVSAADVADVILDAATDGSPRLRYLVGDDARGFIKARAEMADQDYVDFMRSHFA